MATGNMSKLRQWVTPILPFPPCHKLQPSNQLLLSFLRRFFTLPWMNMLIPR
jgi:hypothetical protein